MQNTTGRLLFIIAVSVVMKGELTNETVNYDTNLKFYTNLSQKCKLSKKAGSPGEIWTGFRSSRSRMFFIRGALKIFANPKQNHLCWRHFFAILKTLLKRDFSRGVFLLNLQNIWGHQFWQNSSSGCLWLLTCIFKGFWNETWCDFWR